MHTSKCTSTIETAVYENRTYGGVRGRRLVTASYSIEAAFYRLPVIILFMFSLN